MPPRSNIQVDGLGTMSHAGRSRHWEGEVFPPGEDKALGLEIVGTEHGPFPEEVEALMRMLAAWPSILSDAEEGLTGLLSATELPLVAPWTVFVREAVTVWWEPSDGLDDLHVFINLVHVDHPDEFQPAIDVVNGRVAEVLPGT